MVNHTGVFPRFWESRTLRFRTAVILTAFIIVTALTVGFSCRIVARVLLNNRTDLELREDLQEFAELLEAHSGPITPEQESDWNRRAATHQLHHWFVRVLDKDHRLIWESLSVPESSLSILETEFRGLKTQNDYRVIQTEYTPANIALSGETGVSSRGWVQIGCSLMLVNNSLSQLDLVLMWILGLLVLIGPLLSLLLSTWLLRPLATLTHDTDALPIERSEQVLSIRGSGDELDRLSATINSLLLRVRSQLQQNEDWIANSAHQLRSPLAAIISNVEVVLHRLPDGKSSQMLESVLSECEYLNKLVSQLLILSENNATGQALKGESVRLDQLLSRSSEFFEVLAQSKDVALECRVGPPCWVHANPEHLRIVIHNIVDNAIKYTPTGGYIAVLLDVDDSGLCRLTVRDTGIGISDKDLPRVGLRFFRSDSGRNPNTNPRGTGLGLSIVKSILDRMGGTLAIDSQLGKGTTVTISIPCSNENVPVGETLKI